MQKTFETPGPTSLYVELGSGSLTIHTDEVATTTVDVTGRGAEETTVEQRGAQVVVIAPRGRAGFLGSADDLTVLVTLPHDSALATKLGSADVTVHGRLGETRVKTGSGDVTLGHVAGKALVEAGSGSIRVEEVADDLRAKTGSGDVEVVRAAGTTSVSTGSGDVTIGAAPRPLTVKSGSGDLRVHEAGSDVTLTTASGDVVVETMRRGQLEARNVSGDIRVGIPAGVPVWTDVSSVTGEVTSTLVGAGAPADGQDYVELRAKTVSGDVHLEQR
ncbi:MAG TPA: DUF4097 family beta strand repeat-containing protein [Nocardioides sp.]|nr:DUF4097 family beta strand repeat-containing protein [Nocardioides sp.]